MTSVQTLPSLYKTDARGVTRIWTVSTRDATVTREYGVEDGKIMQSSRIFQAKNIGKANETSASQQAIRVANKEWVDQLGKGYLPKCKAGKAMHARVVKDQEETGGHGMNVVAAATGGKKKVLKRTAANLVVHGAQPIKPMKAHVWELCDATNPQTVLLKVTKYFGTHVYVQPKLDGYRCTAMVSEDGSVVLGTNNMKQFPWFNTIREELKTLWASLSENLKSQIVCLDGEVYSQSCIDENGNELSKRECFSMIQSICGLSKSEPHPLEDQLQYHIFDIVTREELDESTGDSEPLNQARRFRLLDTLFKGQVGPHLVKVPHALIPINTVPDYHDHYAEKGYEGVIIRAQDLIYEHKRSQKLRKYKNFIDGEFKVVGALLDEGVATEQFRWQCVTVNGDVFKAKPEGSRQLKLDMWKNRKQYIGQWLTVKYQPDLAQAFDEDGQPLTVGVPRFPIGKTFRDDL